MSRKFLFNSGFIPAVQKLNKLIKAFVISKVNDGYLVSFKDHPERHVVIKSNDDLKTGQAIFIKKRIEYKVSFDYHSEEIYK